ncbi:TPA: phosphoribosylformylglycinamidine synthase subunit PurQ [Pasteurella multocida]|nr:phosphoribosylformylglycinamidine synthase subunit PurQ [Pasteurella multocida]
MRINETNSLWFQGMVGSHMPIVVSHGEGRVEFKHDQQLQMLKDQNLIVAQYIDNDLNPRWRSYPYECLITSKLV